MTSVVSENGNPFPGLRSFEREQAHLFFGRDDQIKDLIERLQRRRFLPIVGVSGSGKSSLVRAGLIPNLTGRYVSTKTSGWRIAVFRPGRDPMHELAETLCKEFDALEFDTVLQTLRGSSAGLAKVAQQHLADKEKLMVLVDQFEELFRYREDANAAGEANDAAAFVKLLLAAAGESEHPLPGFDDLPIYVVTTMRSDFLGKCSSFRGLPEALNRTQYLIPRLTREQQRDVIEGPIGMQGASIEPALVQRLLNDLGDNPNQLPLLQHALMRSWEQSAGARAQGQPITVADYEAIGGMADALNRDADRVYASLADDAAAKTITRRLFQRLVQPGAAEGDTRSPTPLSELVAVTAAKEEDVRRVIDVFHKRGFLTVSGDENPIIDIPHESLIRGWRQLTTWVQEETRSAVVYRRLADQAALYANDEASLLIDPQLQLMLTWREETKPNEAWAARYDSRFNQAMEFLEQSRKDRDATLERREKQRQTELWRTRFIALLLATLLVLAIGALAFAAIQRNRAVAASDRNSRLLYHSNIYFASAALASSQPEIAQERLDEVLNTGLRELRGFEWFYLWRALHGEEGTLANHSDTVFSVAFSPDGKTLASASADKTVKLWDSTTRKELGTLSGHSDAVRAIVFSPDGKILASASDDKTVKLWNSVELKELGTLFGHSGAVYCAAFSPDGQILASASDDRTVKLWDVVARKELVTLSGHGATVYSLAFSLDGKTLASASSDNTVKLWDTASRKELVTLSGHSGSVQSVAFSPEGKILVSASGDKTIKLWDIATRKELATLSGHSETVRSIVFSPDGITLASASADGTVNLWDTATRAKRATLAGHYGPVLSIAFSPNGKSLASGSSDTTVRLWDADVRKESATLSGHVSWVLAVAFSPDGKMLTSASGDRLVKLWDRATRTELATLSGHSSWIWSVKFSPDGKTLSSASEDETVKLWDIAARKELVTLSGHSEPVYSVAFSPDGKILASASGDNTVKLWDTISHTEVATLRGHTARVDSVTFSPDGKTLASASGDETVKLWDTTTRTELTTFSGHRSRVLSLAFSPDGKTLASSSVDSTVKLWDIASRVELHTLSGHFNSVYSIAFSPDGKTLASASGDDTVKLWDIATLREMATLSGHSDDVNAVAFSPDGKALASASSDKTVKLWFAAAEEEVEEWRRRDY